MSDTLALTAPPPRRSLLSRIPLIGRLAREIDRDVNNFFWLLPVFILGLVLGVKFWGLAALTMVALVLVPMMFAFFIAITWP
ncbi:hypothetical protein [Pseudogemmobacter bohemicus]|uniref:hypothetical protein n=1 Tax=Pseudogemmobacter bohemicus TaxID=2250708 RepID=UPI000DD40965|nr:hypothetical protein [Pseudogemmobacter bohemicus]